MLNKYTTQPSANFDYVCEVYKKIIMAYIGEDLSVNEELHDKRTDAWQNVIDWGLRFLAAPVAVIDYKKTAD